MFKKGDLLVYKKDVCIVEEVKDKYINNLDYYILSPTTDKSLKIQVPTTNNAIRNLITKEQIEEIIKNIKNIDILKTDTKNLENNYKQLMKTGTHKDLIKIIKTT